MRLLKLVGVLSLVVILSTGCYKNDNSSENPINLFDELPIYNQEKKDISDKAKRIAGSANLILPYNSIEVGKINEVDLNNDGKNEVVFFEKRENINNEVGFTVLESKDDESKDALYTESGDKIKYANFYDLDNDGNKEIILVVEEKNDTTLTICRYENGEIKELVSKNSYDYFNQDKFLKLGIVVDDIDNDDNLELIIYNYNYAKKEMNLNLCELKDDKINIIDTLKFDDVKNFDDINISVGKIGKKDKGLFLSLPTSKNSKFNTEVVYLENNKLIDAFKDHKDILNDYYIAFEDVNNDGITNIPIIDIESINKDSLSTSTMPKSLIISWNKYNGKEGKDADLLFVNKIYYNYELNIKFLIPNNLVGKISINENTDQNTSSSYKIFNFYYNESSTPYLDKKNRQQLFSLNLAEKGVVDDSKTINNKGDIILESDKYVYSIYDINEKLFNKLGLSIDILKDYFSIIK